MSLFPPAALLVGAMVTVSMRRRTADIPFAVEQQSTLSTCYVSS
jgi:hypothetical protein